MTEITMLFRQEPRFFYKFSLTGLESIEKSM